MAPTLIKRFPWQFHWINKYINLKILYHFLETEHFQILFQEASLEMMPKQIYFPEPYQDLVQCYIDSLLGTGIMTHLT